MENQYYRLMINNASAYIDTFNPTDNLVEQSDRLTIFEISSALAICTGKLKEDIVMDIVNNNRELTFVERVNLFYNIWGTTMTSAELGLKIIPISFYFDIPADHPNFEKTCCYISKDELKSYIDDGMIDALTEQNDFYHVLLKIMDANNVPKRLNEIQLAGDNTKLRLHEYK